MQVWENSPYRGYLSSVDPRLHFGLGSAKSVDSVIIVWPNGKKQTISHINTDTVLVANIANANEHYDFGHKALAGNPLFKDITDSVGIHFTHREKDFVDFNIQKLLPHKLSEYSIERGYA